MASADRTYDVVVWGASGFTGRLVAEYLVSRYGVGGGLRWTIAGRNQQKLEEIRKALGAEAAGLEILTADSHNPETLDALVKQTKVVCTTVGPYPRYGAELVAACVRNGTDYCDLTGEVPWMRKMIDAHELAARESGARIVHTCGFDSIPSDMGVYFLQREAREKFGKPCVQIKFRLKAIKGGASGGTIASMLDILTEAQGDREAAKILVAPYSLNPEGDRKGPDSRDQTGVVWDADADAWTAPFLMSAVNTKVVRRTNAITDYGYGRDFRYDEAMMFPRGAVGLAQAVAVTVGLGGFMLAGTFGPTRRLLERYVLPAPGQGPSEAERKSGFFDIRLIGKLDDGTLIRGRVTGDRDPGYGSTAKMLAEAAVCLAKDEAQTGGGFWTPASAMGQALLERLQSNAGLSFRLE